jgi:hypothetical protein
MKPIYCVGTTDIHCEVVLLEEVRTPFTKVKYVRG